MGFSLAWVAVQGASRDAVLAHLQLRGTGNFEHFTESACTGVTLPQSRYLIVSQRDALFISSEKTLAGLSHLGEVVYAAVEEHVMVSAAAHWSNGRCVWSVTHDSEKGLEHLTVKGEPPPILHEIHERLSRELAADPAKGNPNLACDYMFDAPVELAQALTGYRHDVDLEGLGENAFEVLECTRPAKSWFWMRWFGG